MNSSSHTFVDIIHTGNIQIIGFPNKPLGISDTYVYPIDIASGLLLSLSNIGPIGITPVGQGGIIVQVTDTELIISGNTSGNITLILLPNTPSPIQDQGFPVQIYSMGNIGTFIGSYITIAGKAYLIDIDAIGLTSLDDAIAIQTSFLLKGSSIKRLGSSTTSTNSSLNFTSINISLVGLTMNFIASISASWTLKLNVTSV